MKNIIFKANSWESNSYLVISKGEAALIDAGINARDIITSLEEEGAKLKYILLTHGHFDHTVSADRLRELTGAKLLIHKNDAEMLADATKSALALFLGRNDCVKPCDATLEDGEEIPLGNESLKVIHTRGHSPGSVCYLVSNLLFTGDTIFVGGYGRCDLYGGSSKELFSSLGMLSEMDENLNIYPGHGEHGTLGKALDLLNL